MTLFILLMLSGTFVLGYNDILRKKYLVAGVHEQALVIAPFLLSGAMLLTICALTGLPHLYAPFWPVFSATVALNIVSQYLFIHAFKASDASTIAPLRLIIPPLVIVTGFIFLNEKPDAQGVLGILTTVIGLWILLFADKQKSFKHVLKDRGILMGLAGSVLFAISFPLDKQAVLLSSGLFFAGAISFAVGLCTLLLIQIRERGFAGHMLTELKQRPAAFALLSVTWGIGAFLTNEALNYSLAAYAASFKRLQALWTVVLSGHFLGEKGLTRKLFATVIMLAGIAITVM